MSTVKKQLGSLLQRTAEESLNGAVQRLGGERRGGRRRDNSGMQILQGEADEVPHEEIAAELGISTTAVDNRLFRMRAQFRARLASLGMLTILLILFALLSPVGEVASPPPPAAMPAHAETPAQPAPQPSSVPSLDGGAPPPTNRQMPSEEIAPSTLK